MTSTGLEACRDKESVVYAELRLIDGCHRYDMNELVDCRKSWEESLRVRSKLVQPDDMRSILVLGPFFKNLLSQFSCCHIEQHRELGTCCWKRGGSGRGLLEVHEHLADRWRSNCTTVGGNIPLSRPVLHVARQLR